MREKTEIEKITIGEQLADILILKEDFRENNRQYDPIRYKTIWGNKTALGIYETVKRILEE